jgi:hypothetical protein
METLMKNPFSILRGGRALLVALMVTVIAVPLFSLGRAEAISLQVVNNSSLEIRHLYLSPVDNDDWGPDQLNGTVIHNGESFTLQNVTSSQSSIKVVAEDQNGCFLYGMVSASEDSSWTITNSSTPSCGN